MKTYFPGRKKRYIAIFFILLTMSAVFTFGVWQGFGFSPLNAFPVWAMSIFASFVFIRVTDFQCVELNENVLKFPVVRLNVLEFFKNLERKSMEIAEVKCLRQAGDGISIVDNEGNAYLLVPYFSKRDAKLLCEAISVPFIATSENEGHFFE